MQPDEIQVAFFMPRFIFRMYKPFDPEGERIYIIPASIAFVIPQGNLSGAIPLKPLNLWRNNYEKT